ncbi:hypothetical protein STEG23_007077 [Scotinomys teguina]
MLSLTSPCYRKRRNMGLCGTKPFLETQGIVTLFIQTAQFLRPEPQTSMDHHILGIDLTTSPNLPSSLLGFQSLFPLPAGVFLQLQITVH